MDSPSDFRWSFRGRLREVRIERFGEDEAGLATLADALGLPPATWRNYESGIVMPAEVLLKLIKVTRILPHWLLTGDGERYASDEIESRGSE